MCFCWFPFWLCNPPQELALPLQHDLKEALKRPANQSAFLLRMVEEGLDVLPIDASFRIIRKQQEPKILDSEKCVDLSIVNIRICLQMLVKFI